MLPREPWYKTLPRFWPIVLTAVGLTVSAASANTRLVELSDRVDYVYANGAPVVSVRLARIETQQAQMAKQLDRMEDKEDKLYDYIDNAHRGR